MAKRKAEFFPNLYLYMGPPGCGKTFQAEQKVRTEKGIVRIERDELRYMLSFDYNPPQKIGGMTREMSYALADIAFGTGFNVIFSNTYCFKKDIEDVKQNW